MVSDATLANSRHIFFAAPWTTPSSTAYRTAMSRRLQKLADEQQQKFDAFVAQCAAKYGIEDQKGLASAIRQAEFYRDGYEDPAPDDLDKLAAPLLQLFEVLNEETNWNRLCKYVMDRAYRMAKRKGATGSEAEMRAGSAAGKLLTWIDDLEWIRRAAKGAHRKPRSGRRKGASYLISLVHGLADFYAKATGEDFTQDWQKGRHEIEPITRGCSFVYEIVGFIDPDLRHRLPTVTRQVVSERKAKSLSKT